MLIQSLLWIDGQYWWPYLVVFTLFLAPAERWLGHLRWLLVGSRRVTSEPPYLSEGYLYWRIQEAVSSPRLIDARDIGVSYFVVGIVGCAHLPHVPDGGDGSTSSARWSSSAPRWPSNATSPSSVTSARCSIGLACYPLTPVASARRRRCVNSGLWRSATTTSTICAAAWNSPARRSTTATNRSARSWSTATARTLFEDRNRVKDGDATRHPEFAIARWAVDNLTPAERARATVYTSGEHCPMCAAAHAWVGLGRIVYATSSEQLSHWRAEWGAPPSPVAALPITDRRPGIVVDGPAPELADAMKALYEAKFRP